MDRVKPARLVVALALALALGPAAAAGPADVPAADLSPAAAAAFERYVSLTQARLNREWEGRSPLLWIERQPTSARADLVTRLARGEIVSERLETREASGRRVEAEDARIHHWVGTIWLPGATVERAIALVQDYGRYPEYFSPLVRTSRVLGRSGDTFTVRLRTSMSKMKITVVLDGDYAVAYRRLSAGRVVTHNVTSNIFDVHDAGTPQERRTPGDRGPGWLWRLVTWCAFEARPGGVYEQCESVSLTRDVPFGLGWLINPFINSIPRESLEFTLGRVREELR
jgi:hypothetical protein